MATKRTKSSSKATRGAPRAVRRARLLPQWRLLAAGTALVVVLAGGGYVALHAKDYLPGFGGRIEEFVARQIDARVKHVLITGTKYTTPKELEEALGLKKGASLVGFNANAARERLESLPWVRVASVVRELPSTVKVEIYEHRPLARLATADGVWIINPDGEQITKTTPEFDHLPLLQGDGAAAQASALFSMLASVPDVMQQLTRGTYIGGRRWDLSFADDVLVKLPADNVPTALKVLGTLNEQRQVLRLKGAIVDLRLPDRIVLRLPHGSDQYL